METEMDESETNSFGKQEEYLGLYAPVPVED